MKKLGIIFIVLGLLLVASALIFGPFLHRLVVYQQILLVITGLPLHFLGFAFLFIQRPPERRKKATLIFLILSVTIMLLGIGSSFIFHAAGGRIELMCGIFLFNFSFIPLHTKTRYEKWSVYVGSKSLAITLTAVDTISITLCVLGFLFSIQQWPGATWMLISGVIAIALNMIGWNRILGQQLILRKKAEEKLEIVHHELKEKHDEIQDSIAYAKRIQSAILPPSSMINENLPDSFVLYKPKDVVAGDFYWMEKSKEKVLFAVADCTGHGVPGAMVSVICNSGLNRSVNEFGLTEPGKILDKTREIVIREFEKSEEEVKDGMDIALCSLEGQHLEYSGAHNSLWLIRKTSQDVEQIKRQFSTKTKFQQDGDFLLIELKADKQPIGKYAEEQPFNTHEVKLEVGDVIYLYSDGYADQFGGDNLTNGKAGGKKLKTANFKRFLLSIQDKSMEEQKELLDQKFENWRGSIEQIDDVCVIGVRF